MNKLLRKIRWDWLTNDKRRVSSQFLAIFFIFAFVSLTMSILNYFTHFYLLMYSTLIFGILNIVNILLAISKNSKINSISHVLFGFEVIALFTFFTITGEPEGFATIWSALLPTGGMILFRKKWGTILSGLMWLILVFLFYTPIGNSLLMNPEVYSHQFMLRFPLLYVAFFSIGIIFELLRSLTHDELMKSREEYRVRSVTDSLTGLGNEAAYFIKLADLEKKVEDKVAKYAVIVMDVNGLKVTNDTYGHRYGCHLIVKTASIIKENVFKTSSLFHIGGDEFVVIVEGDDYDNLERTIQKLDSEIEYRKITFEDVDLILSVARGFSSYCEGDRYRDVFQRADNEMYTNKKERKEKYNIKSRNNN